MDATTAGLLLDVLELINEVINSDALPIAAKEDLSAHQRIVWERIVQAVAAKA